MKSIVPKFSAQMPAAIGSLNLDELMRRSPTSSQAQRPASPVPRGSGGNKPTYYKSKAKAKAKAARKARRITRRAA